MSYRSMLSVLVVTTVRDIDIDIVMRGIMGMVTWFALVWDGTGTVDPTHERTGAPDEMFTAGPFPRLLVSDGDP